MMTNSQGLMIAKSAPCGPMKAACSNTFFLEEEQILIEPATDYFVDDWAVWCKDNNVKNIAFTHNHLDHTVGLMDISTKANIPLLYPQELSQHLCKWKVIFTPGHSNDHVSLYHPKKKVILLGDALDWVKGIPNTNKKDFFNSLLKIRNLDVVIAYPSHGNQMDFETLAKFIDWRLAEPTLP